MVILSGESFLKFLQEEHGHSKKWIVGEILQSLAMTKNVEKTFKSIFGKSIEDLSKEWHRKRPNSVNSALSPVRIGELQAE